MKHLDVKVSDGFWIVKDRDSDSVFLTTNRKESAIRFGRSLNSLHGTGLTIYHETGETEKIEFIPKNRVWLKNVLG